MLFHEFATWSQPTLSALAGMAQSDEWEYQRATSERPLPILRNYVIYTFRRCYFQGKVPDLVDLDGARYAVFNTGLLTPHFESIYGYFVEQAVAERPQPWHLTSFMPEIDYRLTRFDRLPDRASYFDEPGDLLYDNRLDLRVQFEHIVNDNVDRFPVALRHDERRRVESVRQAVRHAEFRVQQNYKTAIPQFYWPTHDSDGPGKIQLLLPLCLEDVNRADLALSVDRVGAVYRAATVLTLDMAYNNARLIARPDREWLEPTPPLRDLSNPDEGHAELEADQELDG